MSRPPVTARRPSGHRRAPMRCLSWAAAPAARRRSAPTRITRWSSPTTLRRGRRLVLGAGRSAGDVPGARWPSPLCRRRHGHQPGLAGAAAGLAGAVRRLDRAAGGGRAAPGGDLLRLPAGPRRPGRRGTAAAGDPPGRRQPAVPRPTGRGCPAPPPPPGFPGHLRGEHRGRIDLKAHGIAPIVDLARLFALEAGSHATATVDRLRAAAEHGTAGKATAADLAAAFATFALASATRSAAWRLVGHRTTSSPLPSSPCSSAAGSRTPCTWSTPARRASASPIGSISSPERPTAPVGLRAPRWPAFPVPPGTA